MALNLRALWARTNHAYDAAGGGFKGNTPGGWASEPPLSGDGSSPFWWTGNDSVLSYSSYGKGSGYAAITKATSIVVNRLASSDWSLRTGDEGAVPTTPRWLSDPMLCRPDDRFSTSARPASLRLPAPYFWGQFIRSALLYGMGPLVYQEDANGQPLAGSLFLLRPDSVRATDNYGGREVVSPEGYSVAVDFDNRLVLDDGAAPLRLIELRNPTTPINPETGFSIGTLQHHMIEMGLVASIAEYETGTFTSSGVPSGYLKVNSPQVTQPQADKLKADWMRAHGTGKRSVAVLNSTVEYSPISVTPVDAELAEMKRLSLVDVANAFCVPLFMLGAPPGHSNVYSNVATEQQALWVHTLQPWARCIEATLSALLPAGTDLRIALPAVSGKPEGSSSQPSDINTDVGEKVAGNNMADQEVNEVIA